MAYFDTITNDPTLMELSVASHQVPSVHDPQYSTLVSTSATEKSPNVLKGQSQYYCCECQRALNDEKAYGRHLRSELHFKRSLKMDLLVDEKETKTIHVTTMSSNRNNLIAQTIKQSQADVGEAHNSKYQICPTCHSTVEKLKFGKHLISHYHHHMSLSGNKDDNKVLILENIDKIVKECPFQCHMCGFFCNWDHDFMRHWQSCHESSTENGEKDDRTYWCSLCQIFASTCEEMSIHLNGDYHNEILSVINRCVPMKIKVQ